MRKFYKMTMLLVAFFTLIGTAKAQEPIFSPADGSDDHWYQIINARDGGRYVTVIADGYLKGVEESAVSDNNTFKLVGTSSNFQIFCKADPTQPIGAPNQNGGSKMSVGGGDTNTFQYSASSNAGHFVLATTGGQCLDNYGDKISFWGNFPNDDTNRQYRFKEVGDIENPTMLGVEYLLMKGDIIAIESPANSVVKYTLDGTDPKTSATAIQSTSNTVDITLPTTGDEVTVKAISFDPNTGQTSGLETRTYTFFEMTEAGEYLIKFGTGSNYVTSVTDDAVMTNQVLNPCNVQTQTFKIIKSTTKEKQGVYNLMSDGKNVYYAGGYKVGTTALADLKIKKHNTAGYLEVIRVESNKGMNPNGGVAVGARIEEYNMNDGGNKLNFIDKTTLTIPTCVDITVNDGTNGTGYIVVAGRPQTTTAEQGGEVTIHAVPEVGYKFVDWKDASNNSYGYSYYCTYC